MRELDMGERPRPANAVIYARFSTKNQDPRSIDDQFRRCDEYATAEGLTVVTSHKDEAISGCRQDRPGLEQMLAAARKRPLPFLHVLVDDSSRLSRDDIDAKTIVFRTLRAVGVVVHDVSSGERSDDENAELLWGVKGLIDAQYIRDLRKKTHRGLGRRGAGQAHGCGPVRPAQGTAGHPGRRPRRGPAVPPDALGEGPGRCPAGAPSGGRERHAEGGGGRRGHPGLQKHNGRHRWRPLCGR